MPASPVISELIGAVASIGLIPAATIDAKFELEILWTRNTRSMLSAYDQ